MNSVDNTLFKWFSVVFTLLQRIDYDYFLNLKINLSPAHLLMF